MILAVQDDNPKLVNVVAFADVDIEESVDEYDRLVTVDSQATARQVRQQLQLFNVCLHITKFVVTT